MRAPFFTEPSLRARSLALVVVACLGLVAGAAATQAASAPQSGEQPAVREALGGPTQYWFAPQPPRGPQVGAQDFMSLFDRRAKWAKSSQRLDTFKLYQFWVQGATDQQLSVIIKELKRRGLRIALETPPLSSAEGCGQGVEGFDPNPITATRDTVQRLKLLGGTVSVIAFSEPLSFATNVYTGPNACNWSVDQVADRVAAYLTGVLAVHPGLTYGDIESDHADVGLVEQFLAAMRARGKPMSFLHWDVDWETEVHWVEDSAHMAQRARAHGARFGMLYYGRPSDPTSASWLNSARQHAAMFETLTNVRPDDVLFQSFHALPLYTLPEANAAAMTNLVLRYFLRRTSITLNPLQADGASLPVSGALRRTPGGILPNRPVQVVARALDGPGFVHEFRIDSVVPANASEALIGIRVNTECSCAGNAYLELLDVQYIQSGTPVAIPNSSFDAGLDFWGVWGTGTTAVATSSLGVDNALYINSSATQFTGVNSTGFPVTPGARFTVIFRARVLPSSEGSGYFTILFPSPTGDHRKKLQLSGVEYTIGTRTDASGNYSATIPQVGGASSYRVTVNFPGDAVLWPAYARREGP